MEKSVILIFFMNDDVFVLTFAILDKCSYISTTEKILNENGQFSKLDIPRKELVGKLTHFMALISFDTPLKHQKISGFLMFSVGINRDSDMKWRLIR